MKNRDCILITLAIVSMVMTNCGNDEEPFVCETNTKFNFAGSNENWCGRSEFRQYSYDESTDVEAGNIFV